MLDKLFVARTLFMFIIFIIGLTIAVFAFRLTSDLDSEQCSDNSKNAIRGLLVMGVCIICISGTAFACGCLKSSNNSHNIIFTSLILIISVITLILSSIIKSECKKVTQDINILLTMSIISTTLSVGYLSYNLYEHIHNRAQTEEKFQLKGG